MADHPIGQSPDSFRSVPFTLEFDISSLQGMNLRREPTVTPLFQVNEELSGLVTRFLLGLRDLPEQAFTYTQLMYQVALVKALKTHSALQILARKGFAEDATVLLRTLLELAIDVRYVWKHQDEALAARWWTYDVVDRYESIKALRTDPSFVKKFDQRGHQDPVLVALEREAQEAQKQWGYWSARKDGALGRPLGWAGKGQTIRVRAESVGWQSIYNTLYKLGSVIGHSSSRSAIFYTKSVADRGLRISTAPDVTRTEAGLVQAFALLHSVVRNWMRLCNPPEPFESDSKAIAVRFLDVAAKREEPGEAADSRRALRLWADIDE